MIATTRHPERLAGLGAEIIDLASVPRCPGALVLHSIPPGPNVVGALGDAPARVVYLSTTGVYEATHFVDETTPVDVGRAVLYADSMYTRRAWLPAC